MAKAHRKNRKNHRPKKRSHAKRKYTKLRYGRGFLDKIKGPNAAAFHSIPSWCYGVKWTSRGPQPPCISSSGGRTRRGGMPGWLKGTLGTLAGIAGTAALGYGGSKLAPAVRGWAVQKLGEHIANKIRPSIENADWRFHIPNKSFELMQGWAPR